MKPQKVREKKSSKTEQVQLFFHYFLTLETLSN